VRYKTHVKPTPQMKVQEVVEAARRAKEAGSTRFCMGAAWRELGNKQNAFKHILSMVREVRCGPTSRHLLLSSAPHATEAALVDCGQVNGMGLEVCATLGMLNGEQARQLKEAGLTAYNHNLDTSREYYPKVRWAQGH
jgi:biotin synthase